MRDLVGYALYSLVGLTGVLLVFSVFSDAETESQVERLNSEIMTIVTEVRKTHRGHPNKYGTGIITDRVLILSGIAPATTISGSNTLENAFGGDIQVTGIANDTFAVDFSQVPQEVCIQSLSRLRPDARVIGARVASGFAGLSSAAKRAFPIPFSTAASACANTENAIRVEAR